MTQRPLFWGPITAKANFCEEDYTVTRYAAEFMNTLTNVVYIIYAIYGLYQLWQKPNAGLLRSVPYLGLMAVGICSALFHVSLKYHTQMLDDISMLFTSTPVLHRIMTANASRKVTIVLGIILGSSLLALVIYYVKTDELLLHSMFFVSSVTIIGIYTMRLINVRTLAGSEARRQIWGTVRFGAVIFNLGYWLWLVDGWVAVGGLLLERHPGDGGSSLGFSVGASWMVAHLHWNWRLYLHRGDRSSCMGDDHRNISGSLAWPAPWAAQSVFAGRGSDKKQA